MAAAIAAGWMGVAGAQGAGAGGSGVGSGKDTSSSAGSRTPDSTDMQTGTGTGPRDSTTQQKADEKAMGTEPSSTSSGTSAGSGSMSGSTGAMGSSDTKATGQAGSSEMTATLAKLHAGNEAEVQGGKYMQEQASNGKVKGFAKKMVDDHTALDKDAQKFAQKHSLDLTTAPEYKAKSSEGQSSLDEMRAFNGFCGAESGYVPVSTVAPAVLIGEIELQRVARANERSPILPAPWLERAARP
jgi:hypothetical protein